MDCHAALAMTEGGVALTATNVNVPFMCYALSHRLVSSERFTLSRVFCSRRAMSYLFIGAAEVDFSLRRTRAR
jgi:hypothetical protein